MSVIFKSSRNRPALAIIECTPMGMQTIKVFREDELGLTHVIFAETNAKGDHRSTSDLQVILTLEGLI